MHDVRLSGLFQLLDFEAALVQWFNFNPDPDRGFQPDSFPTAEGTFPDGNYTRKLVNIQYCCRADGFIASGIHLAIGKIEENCVFLSVYYLPSCCCMSSIRKLYGRLLLSRKDRYGQMFHYQRTMVQAPYSFLLYMPF